MTRDELERDHAEYQRELKRQLGAWYDVFNWNSLLPDPWTVLLEREDDGHTLQ